MKKTFVNAENIKKALEVHPTPFHIYDETGIRQNVREFLDAFSWNKGFKEYFAIKANPNPVIINILKEEGCGVDCSSLPELMLAKALGFEDEDIFFSSNNTLAEEYVYAKEIGAKINLDDFTHIDFLEKVAGLPKELCCRYNPGNAFTISNDIMDRPSDAKYGFTHDQIVEGYKILHDKGVETLGIHSFLASNNLSNDYYPALARLLFQFVADLKKEHGITLSYVNLSGGIGVPYRPEEHKVDIYAISEGVKEAFDDILVPAGLGDIRIFTELGRYILAPYGNLIATAVHRKNIYKNYIGLDACAANLMRPAMYGAYHHITVLGKENEPENHQYDIVGSLCENNDKFAIDRMLPEIEIGDIVAIHDAGAHGHAMGYNYNGKLRSAEILMKENGDCELIRRAETVKDYFATIDFLNVFE